MLVQVVHKIFERTVNFVLNYNVYIDFVPIKEDNIKCSVLDLFNTNEVMKWSI